MKKIIRSCSVLLVLIGITYFWLSFDRERLSSNDYFQRVPLTIAEDGIPVIDVLIQNTPYKLRLESGDYYPLALYKELLGKLNKISHGMKTTMDMEGRRYETLTYIIPEMKIGSLVIANPYAKEVNEEFIINNPDVKFPTSCVGGLGRSIFKTYNFLLDFQNQQMVACPKLATLQKKGLISRHLHQVPFTGNRYGMIIDVETDEGIKKFVLCTESSRSKCVVTSSICSSVFKMNGYDFGPQALENYETVFTGFDGELGMDFLKRHVLYIDFAQKVIYIDLDVENT